MIKPHGGKLVNRFIEDEDERNSLLERAKELKKNKGELLGSV